MKLDWVVTGLPGSVLNGSSHHISFWALRLGRFAILLEIDLAILIRSYANVVSRNDPLATLLLPVLALIPHLLNHHLGITRRAIAIRKSRLIRNLLCKCPRIT
jgi:hypothetical protein